MSQSQKTKTSLSSNQDQLEYALEATLTAKTLSYLDSQEDLFYVKISDRYNIGISDILVCLGGTFIAIELKAIGNTASMPQKMFIENVIKAGGIGGVCYSIWQVKQLLNAARRVPQ